MAKATEEQIRKLEAAHKTQFANLVQAGRFRIMLSNKFGINSKPFIDYNATFVPLVNSWAARQLRLENGGAPKMNVTLTNFSTNAGISKAEQIAKDIDAEGKGIGFVPLLIWAVIAIAAFFTAEQIIDETNNTAEEEAELIAATNKICTDQNLNIEDCKKLITEQTQAVSNGDGIFSGIGTKIFGLAVIYLIVTNFDKFKSN